MYIARQDALLFFLLVPVLCVSSASGHNVRRTLPPEALIVLLDPHQMFWWILRK